MADYSSNVLKKNTQSIKKLHFFIFCNSILDACIKKYVKDTHDLYIPYDFITFYFNECQKDEIPNDYLKLFFLCFNNNVMDMQSIIEIYSKSKTPNLTTKTISRNKLLSGLKAGTYLIVNKKAIKRDLSYTADTDELKFAVEQLKSITSWLNKSSDLVKKKYLIYLKTKNKPNQKTLDKKGEEQTIHKHKVLNNNKRAIAPPAQKKTERVSRLIIPRLEILGMYPKSLTLSRVDSRYFAYHFTTPANQVRIINIYHLAAVKLSDGFLQKRDQIMQSGTKKRSRFDDLF